MELKELIAIFRKYALFFAVVVALTVATALLWQKNQKETYQATLLLNIGRTGVEKTVNYTYDSFYRLQADERFADTVVRWLSSPRVVEDIYKEANLNPEALDLRDLKGAFKAGRLSSQIIEVNYSGSNQELLKQLSVATTKVLDRYTESLNKEDNNENWFVVIGSDPVIRDGRVSLDLSLWVGLAVGMFLGFWIVLFRHYFSEN